MGREREVGVECVPRHNDYMVLGKHKGWRGHSKSIEERGGGLTEVRRKRKRLKAKVRAKNAPKQKN